MSEADLLAENEWLRTQLKRAQENVEILQEALVFCQAPEAVSPEYKHHSLHSSPPRPVDGDGDVLCAGNQ